MELFEKINRSFGSWYEGLFGGSDDVRPKDILRKILVALEEHRKEGFDNRIYVPNQYILEIAVDDAEEKEYLLSFLDRDELETAIRRYCQQNHYHIRGGLDFTIKEVEPEEDGRRREKVRVRCRYDSKLAAEKPVPPPAEMPNVQSPERLNTRTPEHLNTGPEELATVYEVGESEPGTVPAVASARLEVHPPGKRAYEVPIARGALSIGRSARAGNDLVLEEDGLVSRRHARIELDSDGRFTLYDIDTTNGTRVNGRRIDNRTLSSGDEILIGATRIIFRQESDPSDWREAPPALGGAGTETPELGAGGAGRALRAPGTRPRPARLVLTDGERDLDEFILASDTLIGRGTTNDIVLPERSVATRHVRVRRGDPFTAEALDPNALTLLNGRPIPTGTPSPLQDGDRIGLGSVTLRFEGDGR